MQKENIKNWGKIILHTVISTLLFFFFLIFTPTIYTLAQGFVENSFFDSRTIFVGEKALSVKILDSQTERQKGLSGTKSLKEDQGVLFVFDKEGEHGIWMKDMNYPIDIIWLDKFGSIIHIAENVSPNTFPEVFKPNDLAMYVLEVNAGFVSKNYIKVGDDIDLF